MHIRSRAPIALVGLVGFVGLATLAILAGCRDETVTVSDESGDATPPTATQPATPTPPQGAETTAPAPTGDMSTGDMPTGDTSTGPTEPSLPSIVNDGAEPTARAIDPDAPWQLPAGWSESPARPPMRHATLMIDDPEGAIEVAITRFPGDVGGMLANVNRWRGQVGLGPVTEADLPDLLERFSIPGFEGAVIHLRGTRGEMLVASIHETAADRTWFVRVIDAPETIARIKPQVEDFARTFGQ